MPAERLAALLKWLLQPGDSWSPQEDPGEEARRGPRVWGSPSPPPPSPPSGAPSPGWPAPLPPTCPSPSRPASRPASRRGRGHGQRGRGQAAFHDASVPPPEPPGRRRGPPCRDGHGRGGGRPGQNGAPFPAVRCLGDAVMGHLHSSLLNLAIFATYRPRGPLSTRETIQIVLFFLGVLLPATNASWLSRITTKAMFQMQEVEREHGLGEEVGLSAHREEYQRLKEKDAKYRGLRQRFFTFHGLSSLCNLACVLCTGVNLALLALRLDGL
ncbi:transmembrane protein 205 isoform X1 [Paroedura picta]|uniref:transmembrane protein 205 isoform X1 n=1 Tax=Paroedura picta TaxID=143630 RepID=UPI00405635F4